MGVTRQTFDFLHKWLDSSYHNSVCELGDQQFLSCFPMAEKSHCSSYYRGKNMKYVSVDLNGKSDIFLNLNKENDIKGQFSFVTDFGTLEHVNDFYMGLKNMDMLCELGGTMIHVLPAPGHWPNHGSWRAGIGFWRKFGKAQKYIIKYLNIEPTDIGGSDADQVYVVYEKTGNGFISREEFNTFGAYMEFELEEYKEGEVSPWGKILYE
ncbi:MAG: hypothetical protein HC831_11775 [Chloroflexia bacterium]|nr:hypothetical protein [Chloroflexia bacterium]